MRDGTTWGSAYSDLQQALAAAIPGDQILAAAGTYTPGNSRNSTFQLKSGVTMKGGYAGIGGANPDLRDIGPNASVLSGDIGVAADNSDNCFHVVTGSGATSSAVLDGFTISGGNASGTSTLLGSGGGMLDSSGSPTVQNCTFVNNSAGGNGGGGMANLSGSNPTLSNCAFSGNSTVEGVVSPGGGMLNDSSTPTLTDCVFADNSASSQTKGGGVFNSRCSPKFNGCSFIRNTAGQGGGMYNSSCPSPSISGCSFYGNTASSFGGGVDDFNNSLVLAASSPSFTNCTFVGNTSSPGEGGAMNNVSSANALISDCTFSANSKVLTDSFSSAVHIANCVVWGNTVPGITDSAAIVSYSDVEGGNAGGDDINDEPLFVRSPNPGADAAWGTPDDDYGDLRLEAGSPCIDTGANALIPLGITTDTDGNDRIVYGTVDMGSYEWHFPADANGDRFINTIDFTALAQNFGKSSATFSQGDFNYDGKVNALDFNILASKFGTYLIPPEAGSSFSSQAAMPLPQTQNVAPSLFGASPIAIDDSVRPILC